MTTTFERGPEYEKQRRELRDQVNLNHAYEEARLAVCTRRNVGAIVAIGPSLNIIGTGYNGTPSGKPHCSFEEKGCERGLRSKEDVPPGGDYNAPGWKCSAIHAEHNAILTAVEAVGKKALIGGTIYITDEPCPQCATLIESVGITRIVTRERLARELGPILDPDFTAFNKTCGAGGGRPICERVDCGHEIGEHWDPKKSAYGECRATGCKCPDSV